MANALLQKKDISDSILLAEDKLPKESFIHSTRVAAQAIKIAEKDRYTTDAIDFIFCVAMLHNIFEETDLTKDDLPEFTKNCFVNGQNMIGYLDILTEEKGLNPPPEEKPVEPGDGDSEEVPPSGDIETQADGEGDSSTTPETPETPTEPEPIIPDEDSYKQYIDNIVKQGGVAYIIKQADYKDYFSEYATIQEIEQYIPYVKEFIS